TRSRLYFASRRIGLGEPVSAGLESAAPLCAFVAPSPADVLLSNILTAAAQSSPRHTPAGRLSGTNRPIAGASAAITPRIAAHGQQTNHTDGDFTGEDARLRHAAGDPALYATPTPRPRRATDRTTA